MKILFIFDEDEETFKSEPYWGSYLDKYKLDKNILLDKTIQYDVEFLSLFDSIDKGGYSYIEELISKNDVIYFDYGGLYIGGSGAIINWNRFFIKMIEQYRSKEWYCISNMGIFDQDEKEKLQEIGVKFQW
jgi:hypothetical protein